jgi:hypothetical protein
MAYPITADYKTRTFKPPPTSERTYLVAFAYSAITLALGHSGKPFYRINFFSLNLVNRRWRSQNNFGVMSLHSRMSDECLEVPLVYF